MASLEDTVRSVVQDHVKSGTPFTALDVSNMVKQSLPYSKHRETRDIVRGMFATDIENHGWARTPITVTLADGSTAEALLYHDLADSWDIDNKYAAQQRIKTAYKPMAAVQAVVAQAQLPGGLPGNCLRHVVSGNTVPVTVQAASTPVVPAVLATARDQWNSLFQTQPSLFPKK